MNSIPGKSFQEVPVRWICSFSGEEDVNRYSTLDSPVRQAFPDKESERHSSDFNALEAIARF